MTRYDRVKVTKRLARELLEKNLPNNRHAKSISKIPQYTDDMNNGRWNTRTGETIKIAKSGYLVDGQNRLQAFLDSSLREIWFDIAYDVDDDAFPVLDSGAPRTFADVLKGEGVSNLDYAAAAAVVRRVAVWEMGYRAGNAPPNKRPTKSTLLERWRQDTGGFDAAVRRGKDVSTNKMGTASAAGSVFYLFAKINKDQANTFFDQVLKMENLPAGHPALVLGRRLLKDRHELHSSEQVILWVKAWNLFRKDKTVASLTLQGYQGREYTNETFPVPE